MRSFLFLLFLSLSIYLSAQKTNPFNLPSSKNLPIWVSEVNWDNPNVFEIEKKIEEYKKTEVYRIYKKGIEEELQKANSSKKEIEEPYETAYIRWKLQKRMLDAILPDGSVLMDEILLKKNFEQKMISINQATNRQNKTAGLDNWTLLGPIQSILDNNQGSGYDQANVYSIAIAPQNSNVMYCGTEDGVIFKSVDKGQHWFSVSDNMPANSVSSLAIDPNDINIVYAKLFDIVVKTINGGSSWLPLTNYTGGLGEKIIVLPSGRILTIGKNYVWYSNDGGITWTQSTGANSDQMYDIVSNATNSNVIYASGKISSNLLQIFKSTNGGVSFTNVTSNNITGVDNLGSRFAVTPANGNVIYCCAIGQLTPTMMKSTDAGNTWNITAINSSPSYNIPGMPTTFELNMNGGQGFYDFDIMVDPNNENTVIVATSSAVKSIDGGYHFSYLGGYTGGPIPMHVDIQCMRAQGNDAYMTSDGGILHSTDFFTDPANSHPIHYGINSLHYFGFDQGWQEDIVTGGVYHNGNNAGFESYGKGNFLSLGGGEAVTGHVFHGYPRVVDHKDIGVSQIPLTSLSSIKRGVLINTKHPNESEYGKFMGSFKIHPWYRDVFFVSSDSTLWKSTNAGRSYTALKVFNNSDQTWRLDIPRKNTNYIYILTKNGIYKTIDGGVTWRALTLPATYQYYNADIAVDPNNENEVYISMAYGAAGDKVFKTTDGGSTWTNITGTKLQNKFIASINYQSGTNGGLYAAEFNTTPAKMYYRDNTMSDWVDYSTSGIPQNTMPSIHPLIFYRDNKIRQCTSRGILESPLYSPSTPMAQAMSSREYIGCSADTVDFFDYSILNYNGATWLWTFPGATWVSSTSVKNPRVVYSTPGNYDITLKVTDALGQTDTRTFINMVKFPINYCAPDTVIGKCIEVSNTKNLNLNVGTANLNSKTFSISVWVKPNGLQESFGQIFGHYGDASTLENWFGVGISFKGYTPNMELAYTDAIVNYGNYSTLFLDSTKWNNVVLTYSPTEVKLYLNGIPSTVNSGTLPSVDFTQSPMYLNPDIHGQGGIFKGLIDEFKLYNYTLSQNEVREKMHLIQSQPSPESGLIKYLQFNKLEPSTFFIRDVSTGDLAVKPDPNTILTSTAPVSTGTVFRLPNVNTAGIHDFKTADFKMRLPSNGIYPNGEMVAFHLRSNPDLNPSSFSLVPGYFIVNNYGSNKIFTKPDSLIFSGLKNTSQYNTIYEFQLFKRNTFDYGATWGNGLDIADKFIFTDINRASLNYSAKTNVTSMGQFAISNRNLIQASVSPSETFKANVSDIYPNPSKEFFYIDIDNIEYKSAMIYLHDIKGALVYSLIHKLENGKNKMIIMLPKLASGLYNVNVYLEEKNVITRKLIIE